MSSDPFRRHSSSSAILASLPAEFVSMNLEPTACAKHRSVHLLDDQEQLLVKSELEFVEALALPAAGRVKVAAIFGNTGEGKSHTLNHAFFGGEEVFQTSPSQRSCTIGVWAHYDASLRTICIDTEGLLGISKKEHQRTRLLLKVLAIADVIIFRSKAERLPRDMYAFLGGASRAYRLHFSTAFQAIFKKYDVDTPAPLFGPSLIIFHETQNTETLETDSGVNKSPEDIIRENFVELNESFDGFSSIKYIGFKNRGGKTNFDELRVAVEAELESCKVRSARDPKYIFLMLKGVNEKYQREITTSTQLYLSAFFTCQDKCLSCGEGCTLSMGHKDEELPHESGKGCVLQHQYQNFVYLCRKCHNNGKEQVVTPSYQAANEYLWSSIITSVWSGYIIECPCCGKIYQSREYWYGNKDPKDEAVIIKIVHVWPGERSLLGSSHSAQRMLDGVSTISSMVANVGSQPTELITNWLTDQIAPSYWVPNDQIVDCAKCKAPLLLNPLKHHCRACGRGFCGSCSSRTRAVPERGWLEPVRVCDACLEAPPAPERRPGEPTEVMYRKMGEKVISVMKTAIDIPKEIIKESARPAYWTPDNECVRCVVCEMEFGILCKLHHCRECGKGVCDDCSKTRKPVPVLGWDTPQRVCDDCAN